MEKPNIALVGVGKWGRRLAPALDKSTKLSYLVDKEPQETKKWIAENFPKAKSTENLDEVLGNPDVEAVAIATPIDTHFDIAKRALQADKHVFLEKPGGDSSQNLAELTEEAEKRNLVLQIGYEFVFVPEVEEMKKILKVEKVKKISFEWKKWGTFDFHPVINLLVHELSILKAVGIWPITITKYEETKGEHNPDKVHIEAKAGNTDVTFDIDRVSEVKEKTIIIETDNGKRVWKNGRASLIKAEIEAFVDSIQNGTKPIPDGRFAKEILETIEQIHYCAS